MTQEMHHRRERIVDLVNRQGSVSFAQVKRELPGVSEMTLRTDLKALDAERRIVRIHGGARSVGYVVGTDDLLDHRNVRNVEAKKAIARKAAGLVRPDSCICIDSGSTTTALAACMPDERLLAFTNSLTVAIELSRLSNPQTHVFGGILNRFSQCMDGSAAVEAVRGVHFDTFFFGVTNYSDSMGFTCGSEEEAHFKRACIAQADTVVALMDGSKVGPRGTFGICGLDAVNTVVGDDCLPAAFCEECSRHGATVL
ncbi:DeoR/GlpR family DNA-binding transcription regulator [Atopobiaceae bacterium 24-176]